MISLNILLIVFVILFAVIGAMRGWAKELLVSSAVILTIFILTIFEKYVSLFKNNIMQSDTTLFWVRLGILGALVLFAYQTPNIPRLSTSERFMRHYLQDGLLGFVFGALNGYLIFGTLWFFMDAAGYPLSNIITAPEAGSALEQTFQEVLSLLPPSLLGTPAIYFAVAVAFVFILMAFV